MHKAKPVLFAIALALTWPMAATGQSRNCAAFGLVEQRLAERFGETPVGGGVVSAREVLAIYATNDGATWTLVSISADGEACILGGGVDWLDLMPLDHPQPEKEKS